MAWSRTSLSRWQPARADGGLAQFDAGVARTGCRPARGQPSAGRALRRERQRATCRTATCACSSNSRMRRPGRGSGATARRRRAARSSPCRTTSWSGSSPAWRRMCARRNCSARFASGRRASRPTTSPCAVSALSMTSIRRRFAQARAHFARAMEHDPGFPLPIAWAARWHSVNVGQGWSRIRAPTWSRRRASRRGQSSSTGSNAVALATYAHLRSFLFHDYDTALVFFERALSACPNSALAWLLSSATLSYVGRTEDAIRHAEHGLRLSPFDQNLFALLQCDRHCALLPWEHRRGVAVVPPCLCRDAALHLECARPDRRARGGRAARMRRTRSAARLIELEPTFSVAELRAQSHALPGRAHPRAVSSPICAQPDCPNDRVTSKEDRMTGGIGPADTCGHVRHLGYVRQRR